jgi:Nuclease A inhibitor-like protein
MPSPTPRPQDELIASLKNATQGLLYPSESDEPFEPFIWKSTTNDPAKEVAAHSAPGAKIREQSVDDFFAALVTSEDAARYAALRRELESRLKGLRVFRVGEIEVAVYLIGKVPTGVWAGVRTTSVET